MSSPHDALFRHTFGQPEHAAGLFKARLPLLVVEAIDWSTLTLEPGSFVDDNLTWRHSDLLFRASLHTDRATDHARDVFLYLLVEHQSTPHPLMPARTLIYVTRLWSELLRNDPNLKQLPPVLPMVVFHGAEPWNAPVDLHEVIALDARMRELLAPYLPVFRIALEDLSTQTDEQLRARALTQLGALTMLCLQRLPLTTDPLNELRRWLDLLAGVAGSARGIDALVSVLNYLYEVAEPEPKTISALLKPLGPIAEVAIMTTAEKLRELGRQEGREEGRTSAEKLRELGRQEGRAEGRVSTLIKQLQLKFGDLPEAVVARVELASIEDLDRWAERILNATSIGDTLR